MSNPLSSIIDKFYVFVDEETKTIPLSIETLPQNWRNISGLCYMSDAELKKLGWFKFSDPDLLKIEHTPAFIYQSKLTILDHFANLRWEAQTSAVKFNDHRFKLNDATVNALTHKKLIAEADPSLSFNWKTLTGIANLTSADVISLHNKVHQYIQDCFDVEIEFINKVNSINTIKDLVSIEHDYSWPSPDLN